MFDVLQVVFWSITYLLIIVFGFLNYNKKERMIPAAACLFNFVWEMTALIYSQGFWAHVLWTILDIFIVVLTLHSMKKRRDKIVFIASCSITFLCLIIVFLFDGMLISCFLIDILMAFCFWFERRKLSLHGKLPIAVTKLLGDLFAWIYYRHYIIIVDVIGIVVLIVNISYLVYCIMETLALVKERTEDC